jgi:hypothetical protein
MIASSPVKNGPRAIRIVPTIVPQKLEGPPPKLLWKVAKPIKTMMKRRRRALIPNIEVLLFS